MGYIFVVLKQSDCVKAIQGHPRSLILAPIESAYATSYWLSIVTVVLSCSVSEILQVSYIIFHPNFAGVLRAIKIINRVINAIKKINRLTVLALSHNLVCSSLASCQSINLFGGVKDLQLLGYNIRGYSCWPRVRGLCPSLAKSFNIFYGFILCMF